MIPDTIKIRPGVLHGTVTPPPSKSAAHRALICAALSVGQSRVGPLSDSKDMEATCGVLSALGARFSPQPDGDVLVDGRRIFSPRQAGSDRVASDSSAPGARSPKSQGMAAANIPAPPARRAALRQAELFCGESGSTLRFLVPIAAAGGVEAMFSGAGRLPQRPLTPYFELLPAHGCRLSAPDGQSLPLRLSGRLTPGEFALRGDISSQFVTGLLLALPLLDGESRIRLLTSPESAGYIELTLDILRAFGITVERCPDGYVVPGGQHYRARTFEVERDWSQAAFWLAAGALAGPVRCRGLNPASAQGDRAIVPVLRLFGAQIDVSGSQALSRPALLHGADIDASQIPDLVPVLAAVGALAEGRTRIFHAARLRLKESDRLHAMAVSLNGLGARVAERPDGLEISGIPALRGGRADGFHDHRVVMALSVAALRCREPVVLSGCGSVAKSYPAFFEDFRSLGGNCDAVHLG